ncbi:hypothetical protein FRX31_031247 [Thalictrum thalictroides]|uniref:Uncharacterized protein n=1 Tax=Thalictrum thalictroides TaxID=46969 RepID=A0A7J6V2H8_THATH|nr:hypothetical protein FRX31_031247 [Thalictrum thalictroides]
MSSSLNNVLLGKWLWQFGCALWKGVQSLCYLFVDGNEFIVGKRTRVKFWCDRWVGPGIVRRKEGSVVDHWVDGAWHLHLRNML